MIIFGLMLEKEKKNLNGSFKDTRSQVFVTFQVNSSDTVYLKVCVTADRPRATPHLTEHPHLSAPSYSKLMIYLCAKYDMQNNIEEMNRR